nr:hypothetical protein BaRGS_021127 [Batillaria attramentaria]
MCAEKKSTIPGSGFTFNLVDDSENIVLQVDIRTNYFFNHTLYSRMTNLNSKIGEDWGKVPSRLWDGPEYPFPFSEGQQFDLHIKAVTDYNLAV